MQTFKNDKISLYFILFERQMKRAHIKEEYCVHNPFPILRNVILQ